jgi:peptidoglycan/LPS O-acetylase OafA/YrhL
MYTYGFTVLYAGFGALMLGILGLRMESWPELLQSVPRALAYIGRFSYSIYLWHVPFLMLLFKTSILKMPYWGLTTFVFGSVILGIVTSKLIELPAISLRDRLYPSSFAFYPCARDTTNSEAVLETVS